MEVKIDEDGYTSFDNTQPFQVDKAYAIRLTTGTVEYGVIKDIYDDEIVMYRTFGVTESKKSIMEIAKDGLTQFDSKTVHNPDAEIIYSRRHIISAYPIEWWPKTEESNDIEEEQEGNTA